MTLTFPARLAERSLCLLADWWPVCARLHKPVVSITDYDVTLYRVSGIRSTILLKLSCEPRVSEQQQSMGEVGLPAEGRRIFQKAFQNGIGTYVKI
jgi:hypothetical protein